METWSNSLYYDCSCNAHVLGVTINIGEKGADFEALLTMHEQPYYKAGRLVRAWRAWRGKDQLITDILLDKASTHKLCMQIQDGLHRSNFPCFFNQGE